LLLGGPGAAASIMVRMVWLQRPQTGPAPQAAATCLLETIMADEETHIDYLETQLELMSTLGEQMYLAQCVARPPAQGSTA
jgi:hypothetical protein